MKAIGIDIGTTSICGVILDKDTGEVVKAINKNSEAFIESPHEYEKIQAPEKIISLATGILDTLIRDCGGDVAAIGVTGQMHGIVYINGEGEAISSLYTWQDGRGNLPYGSGTYASHLGSCSGYGNVTDFYNRENGLVPKAAVGYCTIHDYFVMKICGIDRPIMHVSDAASLGCFNLDSLSFSYDCKAQVTGDYKIAGKYKEIPVSVAIGDNQASVLSSLSGEGDVLINVGTGSQVSMISDKAVKAEGIEARPFFEGKYLLVGAALCGGRAYAILKDFYKKILGYGTGADSDEVYSIMAKMLESKKSSEGLSVDTRFSGARANKDLRGSVSGISEENFTPENLTYGTLSGMIGELYSMYSSMGKVASGIVGSGNGIRKNSALIRVAEDAFGCPMKIPTHTEEAAYGAAMFSLISAGVYENMASAAKMIRYKNDISGGSDGKNN